MCEVIDVCAEIELNNLVLQNSAHPCAATPIRAILNKTKAAMWGALNAHPCAKIPIVRCRSNHTAQPALCTGRGPGRGTGTPKERWSTLKCRSLGLPVDV